jgi:hypothetical protein
LVFGLLGACHGACWWNNKWSLNNERRRVSVSCEEAETRARVLIVLSIDSSLRARQFWAFLAQFLLAKSSTYNVRFGENSLCLRY